MQLSKLPKSLDYIQKSLSSHERGLEGAKEEMISPAGGALRPEVFENKVVINPVDTD